MHPLKTYWSRNKGVLTGIWFVSLLVLFGLNGGIMKPQEDATTVSLRWGERLHAHQRMLRTTLNQKNEYHLLIQKRLNIMRNNLDRYEQQIATYRFLLNSYDSADAFETILQCRQILDLHDEFATLKTNSTKAIHDISALIQHRKIWLDDLRSDLNKQNGAIRQKIEANIEDGTLLIIELERFLEPIAEMQKRIIDIDGKLNALYETAQERRTAILDDMFFKKDPSFLSSCEGLPYFIPHWKLKIQEWFSAQIPQDKTIWIRLVLFFALFILPALTLSRRYILPFLDR